MLQNLGLMTKILFLKWFIMMNIRCKLDDISKHLNSSPCNLIMIK